MISSELFIISQYLSTSIIKYRHYIDNYVKWVGKLLSMYHVIYCLIELWYCIHQYFNSFTFYALLQDVNYGSIDGIKMLFVLCCWLQYFKPFCQKILYVTIFYHANIFCWYRTFNFHFYVIVTKTIFWMHFDIFATTTSFILKNVHLDIPHDLARFWHYYPTG